ncbi:hypothetical protein HY68_27765 [Streptomyces sp. AcH 505]|nr:hypothetical protein HY68_27765 [Streptomyces sp. AcH 505]
MNTMNWDLASSPGVTAILVPIVGLIVVGVLIGAFLWGRRIRDHESVPPRPDEQTKLPDEGPVREILENREPDEVPESDERLMPGELKGNGTIGSRSAPLKKTPKWNEDSGGSFGSGGFR